MHILAELTPLNTSSGARTLLRAASAQDRLLTRAAAQRWWPAISKLPTIQSKLFDGDFSSSVEVGSASFTVQLGELGNVDANVRSYLWAGAGVTLYAVPENAEIADVTPYALLKGRVSRFGAEGGALALTADVDVAPFQKNVLTAEYAGTTGIEGGADLKGKLKPWILGRALNVEPVMIDKVYNVFQFSAYGAIEAVTALYERGASFGASMGDYLTYAALIAANVPEGRWATCLAYGLVRLGAPPYGVITGDVNGDKADGTFRRRTGAIIARVATAAGVAADLLDASSLNALDAAVPYDINVVINDQMTVLDFARMLAQPCNAQAGVSWLGKLFAARLAIGSPSLTLDGQGRRLPGVIRPATESEVSSPYKRIMMGAAKSWRVHTLEEIASNVNLIDVGQYDAGTTYREGNIVTLPDGSRWEFVGATPIAGSAPTDANTNWARMTEPVVPVDGFGVALATLIADAQATADAKRAVFWQEAAPTAAESAENDIWIKKSTGVTYIRVAGTGRLAIGSSTITLDGNYITLVWTEASDQRIGQAILDAAGAQATADGKVESFTMFAATDPEPVGLAFGDLLFRLYTNPPSVDRWTGTAWAPIATYGATAAQEAAITSALISAANAQAVADGKIDTFYQTSMPSGSEGDLWFDVDDGNKLYRHNGTTFVEVQDDGIGAAITAAAGAQSTADGKVTTFIGESTPTPEGVGDLWYKASTKVLSRWSGSGWVATATAGAPSGTNVGGITADDVAGTINSGGGVAPNKVNTDALVLNAVTNGGLLARATNIVNSSGTYLPAVSITVTPESPQSTFLIIATVQGYSRGTSGGVTVVRLFQINVTNTQITDVTANADPTNTGSAATTVFDNLTGLTGPTTFTLQWRALGSTVTGAVLEVAQIIAIELKKAA